MTAVLQSAGSAPADPQVKVQRNGRSKREARYGWAFSLPFLISFFLVFLIPIGVSLYRSFFKRAPKGGGLYGGGESVNQFVGVQNYSAAIHNSIFWTGLGRVIAYAAIQIPIMIIAAMALALVLASFLVKRVGTFRLSFFLPYAIPGVVAAMVWLYLYTPQISPLVKGLGAIGIDINFMAPNTILWSMANMTTWTYTGYNMLIFLAALQSIPSELYEAARIDGASGWQTVTKIKVPLLSGALMLSVLTSIIGTIQLFNEPAVMETTNTWMGKGYTPMMMAYNTMMGSLTPSGDGPASAITMLMAVFAGVLAAVYAVVQAKVNK